MRSLWALPFYLLGRLVSIGLGRLLFGAGGALLVFVWFGDHPDRLGRLLDTEATVTETRDNCKIRGGRQSAWGPCQDVERKIQAAPGDYAGGVLERWTELTLSFRTPAGLVTTRRINAERLGIADRVAPGDRVAIRYDRKKPAYVVGPSSGGLPVLLQWTGIALILLMVAYALLTRGRGWQELARGLR